MKFMLSVFAFLCLRKNGIEKIEPSHCYRLCPTCSVGKTKVESQQIQVYYTVGNQNGSFRRKYAFPVPFGGRNGSSRRKMVGEKFGTVDRSLTDR